MKQIISFVLVGILVLSGFGVGAFHEDYSFDSSISCFIDENDMVIIAPACFSDAIQPLVEHKNNHDVKTFLKTTEEIYDNYDCRDNPEKIKYFIKYAIEKYNISYVLLVGGFDSIPMRKSSIQWNYLGLNILNHIYTDTYYADIYDQNGSFSSWDSNDNGLYGEYSWVFETPDEFILEFIDSVDLYADVGVGRLPCSNYREVDVLVEKIISYETTTYGSDWFNRVLLLGGDTFPNEGEIEGEFITSYIETIMKEHSFDSVKLWASLDTFSPSLINKEWNKGAGFVSFSGHGNAIQMSTSTDNGNILRYFTPYQKGLNNKNEYPIVFLDACKTARLDISFLGIHIPCFSESLLKHEDGGAIAVIANYGGGYMTLRDNGEMILGASLLNILFFESYEPGITISDMLMRAQNEYISLTWKDCLTLEGYNLLGDPSLKIGGYEI